MLKKLKDQCYIVMGQSPSSEYYNQCNNGIPFLQGRKTFGDKYPKIDTWTTKPLKIGIKNSVLMSVRAPVGDVNIAPFDICIGRGLASIKMKNNNNQYLYYLLKNNIENIKRKSSGTVFEAISRSDLENLVLNFNSEEEQLKIEKILDNIDKKIELNNKLNNNLYEILTTLYKESLNNIKSKEEKTLDEFCNIFTGKKNANEYDEYGKNKFFTCGDKTLKINSYIYNGPAIIISGNGSYTGRTQFYNGKFDLYQRTYACTIKNDVNEDYIYALYTIVKNELVNKISGGTHGSAIPYIVMNDLAKFKIYFDDESLKKLSRQAKIILQKIQLNDEENETLSQLRDTLLPKLMNGEIDLENIEI